MMGSVTTMDSTAPDVTDLQDLLEAEAKALSTANYTVMEELAARKSALLEGLDTDRLAAEEVEILRQQAARNARLFEATLGGLRSVIDRLHYVARASAHLDTYTATGALQDLGPARSSFEKRS